MLHQWCSLWWIEKVRRLVLFFHQRFNFICSDGNFLHQVLITVFSDPEIVFNAYAHLLFFNVNPGLNGKYHPLLHGLGSRAQVMHIQTQVV